jgi:hypothetical protein
MLVKPKWVVAVVLIGGYVLGILTTRMLMQPPPPVPPPAKEVATRGGNPTPTMTKEDPDSGSIAQSDFYHTISDPPEKVVFQTKYKGGTQIVFDHVMHVDDFGLQCIECHHVEACNKCHLKNETQNLEISPGKVALHENCLRCHEAAGLDPKDCEACHHP